MQNIAFYDIIIKKKGEKMKSTHNLVVTKENAKNMTIIGDPFHPVTEYTKDDFLSPSKVAKKFGISTENARNLMKKLEHKGIVFGLNGHKKPVISKAKPNSHTLFLHPMAIEVFQEYLNNQKVK